MNYFIWILILILLIFLFSKGNVIESYDNIHDNKFWNYWNNPNYIRLRNYPLWDNIYWGPSYWPGGKKLK